MVKTAVWLSLDRQLEPYLRANMVAPSWCGLGCRSRTLMVEYISPCFLMRGMKTSPLGRPGAGSDAGGRRTDVLVGASAVVWAAPPTCVYSRVCVCLIRGIDVA